MTTRTHNWVVLKFGGTSVSSRERWDTIAKLVRDRLDEGMRPVVVCSALAGMTDNLTRLARNAASDESEETLTTIEKTHRVLVDELGLEYEPLLGKYMARLKDLRSGIALVGEASPRVEARVLALGELMSTTIGAAFLDASGIECRWHDARDCLIGVPARFASERSRYMSARVVPEYDPELVERYGSGPACVVTQGYIARDARGDTVLLGRGGSDTSASAIACKLGAERVENWTDVPGMFSADPRSVSGARLLKSLDYSEAQEIATAGGAVLDPRAFDPLKAGAIPLSIHYTARPEMIGTRISAVPADPSPRLKAVAVKKGIVLVSMESTGMWHRVGFLADAFRCFKERGLSVDLVSTSETNVTVSLDSASNVLEQDVLDALIEDLSALATVRVIAPCAAISLVGRQIRTILHQLAPALELFEEHRVHLVTQAASDLNFTVVVDEEQADRLAQRLHRELIRPTADDAVLGPTRDELLSGYGPSSERDIPWWQMRRTELLQCSPADEAVYVYHLPSIASAARCLENLTPVDRVWYAMKANAHPGVLAQIRDAGLSFECVSPGELARVQALLPAVEPDRILFTPNFASRVEYEQAFDAGVNVTLDNVYPLEAWPDTFRDRTVYLRIDPGQGRGHHRHVRTAGAASKFGVPLDELERVARLAEKHNVRIAGVHAHAGSGILDATHWQDVAMLLADVAGFFPDATVLNLGGGLGVPDRRSDPVFDFPALERALLAVRDAHPQYRIWLEPGRFLVAAAGVLLARVTQTKGKADIRYVGINTGMNSLIRPALYGAWHEIVNLTRFDDEATVRTSVVGPICESADSLGVERLLPECREGDVMLIANVGAYGAVMASQYNLRVPAAEITLE